VLLARCIADSKLLSDGVSIITQKYSVTATLDQPRHLTARSFCQIAVNLAILHLYTQSCCEILPDRLRTIQTLSCLLLITHVVRLFDRTAYTFQSLSDK